MAILALTAASVYIHDYDFTGDSNRLELKSDVAVLDATTFRSGGWTELAGGLRTGSLTLDGFWQSAASGAVDLELFPDLGVLALPATIAASETETGTAYMAQVGKFGTQVFGKIGELAPFTLTAANTSTLGVIRGQLAAKRQTVAATGALGSGCNLGAVSATQFVYATFHVFSAGTTITAVVESASAGTFAGATTRSTIGPLTTTGSVWITRVAGPITDTWWRLRVSAITGSFSVAGAIGIQ